MGEARLKAASIKNNIAIVRALLGPAGFARFADGLPPETRAILERRLLPVEWVRADDWLPFQSALLEGHFGGDELAFRAYVRRVCERDFNTFYRIIIRLLVSPRQLLERTEQMWSAYNEGGRLVLVSSEEEGDRTRFVIRVEDFDTEHTVFGILLHAFVEQLLAMTGAKDVEVTRPTNRLGARGLECELHVSFRS